MINRIFRTFGSNIIEYDDMGCVTLVQLKLLWMKKDVYKDRKHLKIKQGGKI